ncbi:MAG: hypothetical protein WAT33_08935 [Giesbergeria sp.]
MTRQLTPAVGHPNNTEIRDEDEAIKTRIKACLVFEATVRKQGVRQEALRGLHYLFLSGEEMPRGDFKAMLGMSDRGATDALGERVKCGLLQSDPPQGKVRFGLPQHALRFMFRQLWPEAEAGSANVLASNRLLAHVERALAAINS